MNDVGHFLKSNKPSESGIYKAEDIPKDMLWDLKSVSKEKHQNTLKDYIPGIGVQFSYMTSLKAETLQLNS
jgi:hypothetical protein